MSFITEQTKHLISLIKVQESHIEDFDEKLFENTVATITVRSQTELVFKLINGLELTENL